QGRHNQSSRRQNSCRRRTAIRRSGTDRNVPGYDCQSASPRSREVQAPVLLVRGEYDGVATVEDPFDFYWQLRHGDKQLVILPNTAHSVASLSTATCFGTLCAAFSTCRHRQRSKVWR